MWKYLGGLKKSFSALKGISGHFRPNDGPIGEWSKIMKIRFRVKKSDFEISVGTGQNDDIWSDLGPWDALDMIWAQNWYLNYSRVDFGKIEKIDFLIFEMWVFGTFWPEFWISGQISAELWPEPLNQV